jgi:homoserine O-acetyltransferase
MDLHDIGRGRSGVAHALRRITAPALVMGVSSDALYPFYQQRELADGLTATGVDATYVEIDSPHGHDAFLLEAEQMHAAVASFFDRLEIPHG